jgi:hypothetical protein
MTATLTRDARSRVYRAWCEPCIDGRTKSSRTAVQAWADDHNRTHHPAPGEPDSKPGWPAHITVQDTPERDNPETGSVQVLIRRNSTTDVKQLTRAEALDLQRHLNWYLKQGAK